ncbi:Integrin beta-7 [Cricetulus griseus]|uniref:Integrin beta-7 n=1 Tax=Cricetulus griseus TaxID=10029 RepID=G3IPI1_CRIGR|nr:Integrin beta-7 [Cricetulus griseus]
MGQGPCAAGRDDANVDVAAAADRALGVCASVMMPAVNGMRASSVEALDTANVEYVTVTPTARAEHVNAVRMWIAVSVPTEGSAVGMDTANATVASARMATMGLCVTSALVASHHVSNTECGAFGTGPLAVNCSVACADVNVTVAMVPNLDDGWCKERTQDNQLFFFLVEHVAEGVILRVRPQEKGAADHTRTIILGCIGGIVAVGLGLVLAYRLSVEIYDRREYSRFEKERQQLNWKQDSNPLYKSAITTTINPRFQETNGPGPSL